MKRKILKMSAFFMAIIIALFLSLAPIYKVDTNFIYNNFQEEIEELRTNQINSLYTHEFKKTDFEKMSADNYVTLSSYSWHVSGISNNNLEDTEEGLKINNRVVFKTSAIPDLTNILVVAKTDTNATLKIIVNSEVIEEVLLTTTITKYLINCPGSSESNLTLEFSDGVILKQIYANAKELTQKQASFKFLGNLYFGSGLIMTNAESLGIDSIEEYQEYIDEEIKELTNHGVSFFDLFKMAIVDYEYNSALWKESTTKTDGSFGQRMDYVLSRLHNPFVGILVFFLCFNIFGGLTYISVKYILDLILKKDSSFVIPALIVVFSLITLLNIPLFASVSSIKNMTNNSNMWKMLFFESAKLEMNFVLASILSIVLVVLTRVDNWIDKFILVKHIANTPKTKRRLIIEITIVSILVVMLLIGVLTR